jgi:hypothetical protein
MRTKTERFFVNGSIDNIQGVLIIARALARLASAIESYNRMRNDESLAALMDRYESRSTLEEQQVFSAIALFKSS